MAAIRAVHSDCKSASDSLLDALRNLALLVLKRIGEGVKLERCHTNFPTHHLPGTDGVLDLVGDGPRLRTRNPEIFCNRQKRFDGSSRACLL